MRRPAEAGSPVPLMPPTPVCTVSFSHIAPSDNAGLRTLSPLCNGQEIHKRTAKERRGGVGGWGGMFLKNAVRKGSNYGAGQTGKKKQGGKKQGPKLCNRH